MNKWLAFNIAMPEQLIPIYDFLQKELNQMLSNDAYRTKLETLNIDCLKGKVWIEMRKIFQDEVLKWDERFPNIHNKAWYARILFENIRRELQSKHKSTIIWNELLSNGMEINEVLFSNLVSKHRIYATRGNVVNIKESNKKPELPREIIFELDYTVSDKQLFLMDENNVCQIRVSKKDWIGYEIILPSSLNHNLTGEIAKPRFFKRKSDGQYIGLCSYKYTQEIPKGKNILGVDIGQIKLFSAIALYKNGEYSDEYSNSKILSHKRDKLKRLYKEKDNLYNIINQNKSLGVITSKDNKREEHYKWVSDRIESIKKDVSRNIAQEVIQVAKEEECNEIHIENLAWLGSKGGKWNHSQIHEKIEEKAITAGIKIVKVNAAYTSSEHPITNEKGIKNNRNIKFNDGIEIDRDILASINIAVRNKRKKKNKINKLKEKHHNIIIKKRSRKKEIVQRIAKLKRNMQIVIFQPCVPETDGEGAWSCIEQVKPSSSMLMKNNTIVRCINL